MTEQIVTTFSNVVDSAVSGGYLAAMALICLLQYAHYLHRMSNARKQSEQYRREAQELKMNLRVAQQDQLLTRLENELLREFVSQRNIQKALDVLLRRFLPDPNAGFCLFIQLRAWAAVIKQTRGLSAQSRRNFRIDDELLKRLESDRVIALDVEDATLFQSRLFASLSPVDRQKFRKLFLIAVGEATELSGALLTTALYPSDYPQEQQLELAKRLMQSVGGNLMRTDTFERQARQDGLTELANRRTFDQGIHRELQLAENTGREYSLLLVDLDRFKAVNDKYGHTAGDDILHEVTDILRCEISKVRATDRVLIAPYDGEEMTVLLPGMGEAGAKRIAESIRSAVESMTIWHGEDNIQVTLSVGLATFPNHAVTMNDLIAAADAALYQAKHSGRNRVCCAGEPSSDLPEHQREASAQAVQSTPVIQQR